MINKYFLYIAGLSCSFAVFAYLYKILRLYWKIKVNCWFCNKNFKVEYKLANSFVCPFCEQYNGFNEDGDYNCIIPSQHSELYNFSTAKPRNTKSLGEDKSKFDNGFCESCNLNQALKIRAIAEFSFISQDNSEEIEKFRERLEDIYGLCQQCQAVLNQTLGKQNSWLKPQLISWRLMQTKERVLKSPLLKKCKSSWVFFPQVSLVVCMTLCMISLEKYFPATIRPYKMYFEEQFAHLDFTYYTLLGLGIAVHSSLVLFQEKVCKLKNVVSFIGWILLLGIERCTIFFSAKNFQHLKLASNFSNMLLVFWITRTMVSRSASPKDPSKSPRKSGSHDVSKKSSHSSSPRRRASTTPDLNHSFASAHSLAASEPPTRQQKKSTQEDLDTDLLSLKISTPKKNNAAAFSPQNLFRENSSCSSRCSSRNVVQPSKFGKHFITQASWVAGGYWGSPGSPQRGRLTSQNVSHLEGTRPKPVFSLSRSSSQSSGFVSQLSEGASSKSVQAVYKSSPKPSLSQHSSLCGDAPLEKGSVYSWGGGSPINTAPSFRSPNLESLEAQSACSASSFFSDNSLLHRRPSTQSGTCYFEPVSQNSIHSFPPEDINRFSSTTCKSNSNISYFNLGVAFFLGLSVSANIFLVGILYQYIFAK